jgi:hypothetical protein
MRLNYKPLQGQRGKTIFRPLPLIPQGYKFRLSRQAAQLSFISEATSSERRAHLQPDEWMSAGDDTFSYTSTAVSFVRKTYKQLEQHTLFSYQQEYH